MFALNRTQNSNNLAIIRKRTISNHFVSFQRYHCSQYPFGQFPKMSKVIKSIHFKLISIVYILCSNLQVKFDIGNFVRSVSKIVYYQFFDSRELNYRKITSTSSGPNRFPLKTQFSNLSTRSNQCRCWKREFSNSNSAPFAYFHQFSN
jgi:hypothetical protein